MIIFPFAFALFSHAFQTLKNHLRDISCLWNFYSINFKCPFIVVSNKINAEKKIMKEIIKHR